MYVSLSDHQMKKLIHNLLFTVFLYDRPFSKPESHTSNSIPSFSQHEEVQRFSLKHKDNAFIELSAFNHRFRFYYSYVDIYITVYYTLFFTHKMLEYQFLLPVYTDPLFSLRQSKNDVDHHYC